MLYYEVYTRFIFFPERTGLDLSEDKYLLSVNLASINESVDPRFWANFDTQDSDVIRVFTCQSKVSLNYRFHCPSSPKGGPADAATLAPDPIYHHPQHQGENKPTTFAFFKGFVGQ